MKRITYAIAACSLVLGALSAAPAHAEGRGIGPAMECGGIGHASELRIGGHTGTDGPVTLRAGTATTIELDFRPARSHRATQLHMTTKGAFGEYALTNGAVGAVTAGNEYTVARKLTPLPALAGQQVQLRMAVTGDYNTTEVCVQLDIRVSG